MEAAPSDQCLICNEIILKPAQLECGHQFCSFCIRSIRYKHAQQQTVCPLCRKVSESATLQNSKQIAVIKALLNQQKARVFKAHAATINDYDKNYTPSQQFYYILIADQLKGDIIWGGGTQHNSYIGELGRAQGRVHFSEGGSFQLDKDYRTLYSNTPFQEWTGQLKNGGNNEYILYSGRYMWHGWGRNSSGTLKIDMKQLFLSDFE